MLGPVAALAAVAALLLGGAQQAAATPDHVFAVTTTADTVDNVTGDGVCADSGGQCSLRAAVQEADADTGTTEIDLPAGTYTLSLGQLLFTANITLVGAGARTTSVIQGGVQRVIEIGSGTSEISGVLIQGGDTLSTSGEPNAGVGGGIWIDSPGTLTITHSTITHNVASASGGGIDNNGKLTIDHSTIEQNGAGTIGGGIDDFGPLVSISDSTISSNSAATEGGGLLSANTTTLTNDTFGDNQVTSSGPAGDVFVYGGADVIAINTIFGSSPFSSDCNAALDSHGSNLASDASCSLAAAGDQQGVNPQLGALANNGGPTDTYLPSAASPAIDAGLDGACPTDDQRGTSRPQGPHCDIGAVEVAVAAPPTFALGVTVTGSGSVSNGGSISCPGSCSASFSSGTVVTLTATPASGSLFSGWSGACTGSGNCVVTMSAARSVTATFSSAPSSAPPSSPPAAQPPSVAIAVSPTPPTQGVLETFTATLTNTTATPAQWTWSFGDGSAAPTEAVSSIVHNFHHAGTFTVSVTVTDASGATIATGSASIVVAPPAPHIVLSYSPGIPTATLATNFHFSVPTGQAAPSTVTWSFGDGTTTHGTTQSASHTYAVAGTFTVTVTETDTSGDTLSSTRTLDVAPDGRQPADPSLSTVTAYPPGALTHGTAPAIVRSTVTVTLIDAWHRPAKSATVRLTSDSTTAHIGAATATTNGNGIATFVVSDSKAETVTFSARDTTDGIAIAQTASVIFGPPAAHVSIALSATSAPADGTPVTVTITLTDAQGDPTPGKEVKLAESEVKAGAAAHTPVAAGDAVATNADGVATFQISEHHQITLDLAAVDDTDALTLQSHPRATVTFNAAPGGPASATTSTIAVDTRSVPDDGTSEATITVTLLNASGGADPGQRVTLHTTSSLVQASAKVGTTDANGVATFTATATSPVTATFTADDSADSLTVGPSPSVSFFAHVPDPSTSSIVANPVAVPNDGTSSSLVTVTLRDLGGVPVPGDLVLLQASGSATVTAVSSLASAQGVATFRIADATSETVTLSARVPAAGITFGATTVAFNNHVPSDARSGMTATPSNVVDDGAHSALATVQLLDKSGIPVAGQNVTLVASGGHSHLEGLGVGTGNTFVLANATTDTFGKASFKLVDPHDETVTYTAIDDTTGMTLSKTATVTFSPQANANASSISASPVAVPAGGSTTVTVALRTSSGDPVSGREVKLMGATVTSGKTQPATMLNHTMTDASGNATFTLRRASQTQISLTADAVDDGITVTPHPSLVVSFEAATGGPASTTRSTVSASPTGVRAGGGRTSAVTVTLLNAHGGAVSGATVALHGTGHSTIGPASATTDQNGVATFTVSDATVETATFTAVDTTDSLTLPATASVDFYGHDPDPEVSSITATPGKVADDGTTRATVRVTLEDTGGAPVSGKHVTVHASGGAIVSPSGATTTASGLAVFHVTDTQAETVTLTAADPADHVTLATPAYVRFVALPSATLSTLDVDETDVASNGRGFATVTATLRDAQGRAIPNTLVDLRPLSGSSIVKRKLDTTTGPAGTPATGGFGAGSGTPTNSFMVTDQTAETVTYEAVDTADGITLAQTVTVTFSPPAAPGHAFISISSPTIPADRTTTATITVTLETSTGTPAVGKDVQLLRSGTGSVKIDDGDGGTTDGSGTVTFTVTGYIAGTVTFRAKDVSDSYTEGTATHLVETPQVILTVG